MPNQEETMIKNFVSALPSMGCPAEQVKLEEERFRTMLNDPELRAKREQLRQKCTHATAQFGADFPA
jgi:hypothetical protein